MLLRSSSFPGSAKQKLLWISEISQHSHKYFTDYDRGILGLYKKNVRGDKGLPHNLSLPLPGEKRIACKK